MLEGRHAGESPGVKKLCLNESDSWPVVHSRAEFVCILNFITTYAVGTVSGTTFD